MKEPYGEGVASHTDSESCVVSREAGHEALTGAHVGGVLSREMPRNQDADAVLLGGKATLVSLTGGGHGGKTTDQVERGADGRVPDTKLGERVSWAAPCARSSKSDTFISILTCASTPRLCG